MCYSQTTSSEGSLQHEYKNQVLAAIATPGQKEISIDIRRNSISPSNKLLKSEPCPHGHQCNPLAFTGKATVQPRGTL
ncbi:hypothetical protein AV530_016653 [Patagioenas fasciata monilis]|uniref:Uncharacterized protein n=1 Tax=Patagioenas fasciata monilis TaxID=372326 RepID=A0A1V4J334_PATFA|nr:hypothetical protein AV530_016653 [Patagioenas fasciata monilis]